MTHHGRTEGRNLAFQTLFELEARPGRRPIDALNDRFEALREEGEPPSDEAQAFSRELMTGVAEHREEIDRRIAGHVASFPLEQMAATDRVVLELALLELLYRSDTPPRVVINEAVELGKSYGGENSGKFVNGVLGTIAEELGLGRRRRPSPGETRPA